MTVRICAKCSAYFLTRRHNRRYCSASCRRTACWLRYKRNQTPEGYAAMRARIDAWRLARKRAAA